MKTGQPRNSAKLPPKFVKTCINQNLNKSKTSASEHNTVKRKESLTPPDFMLNDAPSSSNDAADRDVLVPVKNSHLVVNPMLDFISPPPPGLFIIAITDPALTTHVRCAVTRLAATGSKKLGFPFIKLGSISALYSGNTRRQEQAKAFDQCGVPLKNPIPHEYLTFDSHSGFNLCGPEGSHTMLRIIEERPGYLTAEQAIDGTVTTQMFGGLLKIQTAGKKSSAVVMIFFSCQKDFDTSQFSECCDELIVVSPCESSPEHEVAFSLDCVNLRDMNAFGIGKTMCEVRLEEGAFHRNYSPFISSSLESRLMWILRGHGKTFEEIGKTLKRSKTTVMRRLDKLPKPVCMVMPQGLLESYLESSAFANRAADNDDDAKTKV